MIMTEIELARRLGSSYFTECSESVTKRRVRRFAKKQNISPVEQIEGTWLFLESDFNKFTKEKWDSNFIKENHRHTGKSRERSAASAFERARELTTKN